MLTTKRKSSKITVTYDILELFKCEFKRFYSSVFFKKKKKVPVHNSHFLQQNLWKRKKIFICLFPIFRIYSGKPKAFHKAYILKRANAESQNNLNTLHSITHFFHKVKIRRNLQKLKKEDIKL